MENKFNTKICEWVNSLEEQLEAWSKLMSEKDVNECEEFLEKPYLAIMEFSCIDTCRKVITFNSRINSDRWTKIDERRYQELLIIIDNEPPIEREYQWDFKKQN